MANSKLQMPANYMALNESEKHIGSLLAFGIFMLR